MNVGGAFQPHVAADSVAALIGDLAHLVRNVPRRRWAMTAALVIDHHTPEVADAQLTEVQASVQIDAHSLLRTVGGAAESLSGSTVRSVVDKAEEIIARWNDDSAGEPRLLVSPRPEQKPVIDLRGDEGRTPPQFIEQPPEETRWFEFRKLSGRLR